jgi:hypothetical protein
VKILPLLASVAAFLCLMLDHLLCPDMNSPQPGQTGIKKFLTFMLELARKTRNPKPEIRMFE